MLIDCATLTEGRHDDSVCEYSDGTPVPVETARRHACDAHLIPVVLGADSDAPRRRTRPTLAPHRPNGPRCGRCIAPVRSTAATDTSITCHIHHLLEWDDLGNTDIDNLLPLCSFHHHRVHEGRWRLQLDPSTRQLTVTLPNSTHHSTSLPDHIAERTRRTAPPCTRRRLTGARRCPQPVMAHAPRFTHR